MSEENRRLQGKNLHIDCFAGIAGDMFLGAAIDLGVPESVVREGLASLGALDYELRISRAKRMGLEGCNVEVILGEAGAAAPPSSDAERAEPAPAAEPAHSHPHGHGHAHGHSHGAAEAGVRRRPHGHRSFTSLQQIIGASVLPAGAKTRALDIFTRIARAEASLHGMSIDLVEFHEVGALDSLVDIVGAAVCLDHLAPRRITSRRIPLGHGTTRCAHGILPVPSPAVLRILEGALVEDGGAPIELCTPTGAAIAASCVESFGELPAGRVLASGYGVGDRILEDRANLLRLVLLEPGPAPVEGEAVVLEANIDDMNPELCGHVLERLFAVGARDVWFTPILMKKGRPAFTLSALCGAADLEPVGSMLLRETSSIGLRYSTVGRRTLARRTVEVSTPFGAIPVKVALEGEEEWNASPEYEACRAAALREKVPLKEVYAAAVAAHLSSRGRSR